MLLYHSFVTLYGFFAYFVIHCIYIFFYKNFCLSVTKVQKHESYQSFQSVCQNSIFFSSLRFFFSSTHNKVISDSSILGCFWNNNLHTIAHKTQSHTNSNLSLCHNIFLKSAAKDLCTKACNNKPSFFIFDGSNHSSFMYEYIFSFCSSTFLLSIIVAKKLKNYLS